MEKKSWKIQPPAELQRDQRIAEGQSGCSRLWRIQLSGGVAGDELGKAQPN